MTSSTAAPEGKSFFIERDRPFYIALLLIALVSVFYLLTIRQGHEWGGGGDFSLYILHARNLAEGQPYSATGYLFNPYAPWHSPPQYPPVFPAMLAPVYKFWGLNLNAMKVELVLCFAAFLLITFLLFRREAGALYATLAVGIIGFNPYLWRAKDEVLSDIPFLFFAFLSLFLIMWQASTRPRSWLLWGIVAGVSIYLAYGTRSAGIVLFACLWMGDLLQRRLPGKITLLATGVALALILLQNQVLHVETEKGYVAMVENKTLKGNTAAAAMFSYSRDLRAFWGNNFSKLGATAVHGLVGILALLGLLWRLRYRFTVLDVFFYCTVVLLILFPGRATRYLMPIFPIYVLAALQGAGWLGRMGGRMHVAALVLLLTAIGGNYALAYASTNLRVIENGVDDPDFRHLCEFVRRSTAKDDRFGLFNARVLTLYTGRTATTVHPGRDPSQVWQYLRKASVDYLIVWEIDPSGQYLNRLVDRYKRNLELEFCNSDYSLYSVKWDR